LISGRASTQNVTAWGHLLKERMKQGWFSSFSKKGEKWNGGTSRGEKRNLKSLFIIKKRAWPYRRAGSGFFRRAIRRHSWGGGKGGLSVVKR